MLSQLLILLLYLLNFINSIPTAGHYGRYAHSSALMDGKLYFMCGTTISSHSRDMFYLDLSKLFTYNLTQLVDVPPSLPVTGEWSTASAGGYNNSTIFLFGGAFFDIISGNLVTDK